MSSPLNHATSAMSERMLQQAAEWHAHFQSGEASKADHEAFNAWLAVDAEHASIYQKLSVLWTGVESVNPQAGKATLHALLSRRKRKSTLQKTTSSLLGLAGLLLVTWSGLHAEYTQYYLADHRSKLGEQLQVTLADHSEVILDTQSAVNVRFTDQVRKLVLVKGAMFVDVAKDAKRPLMVETEFGTAHALGTQFVVEKRADAMTVAVKESHVKVCTPRQMVCVTLAPGEAVDVGHDHLSAIRQVNVVETFAWTKGNLIADNLPLTTLLDQLRRYQTGKLSYEADALAHIRVSGVFKLTEPGQVLQYLADTMPIQVNTYLPYWMVVEPK